MTPKYKIIDHCIHQYLDKEQLFYLNFWMDIPELTYVITPS